MSLPLLHETCTKDKCVLLRVDLNVPILDGVVQDFTRIARIKPTIDFLTKEGAKIVLLSHFGRPKGKREMQYSLKPLIEVLENILNKQIIFVEDPITEDQSARARHLKSNEILLLENTRFYLGEEANDLEFAKNLARYGDIYVNDAFSASHRAHASVDKITQILPSFAGLSLQNEMDSLKALLENPKRPIAAIVGGAKISTKINLLENLVTKVNSLIIGGGMANSFLAAQSIKVGKSLCETGVEEIIENILKKAKQHNCTIILPLDAVVAYQFKAEAPHQFFDIQDLPSDGMVLDIGPHSIEQAKSILDISATLLWNGPLGAFELSPFDHGTLTIAKYAAQLTTEKKLLSIAGGGDTISALKKAEVLDKFSYVSTAGGAFLEWLEGKELPGITALKKQKQ